MESLEPNLESNRAKALQAAASLAALVLVVVFVAYVSLRPEPSSESVDPALSALPRESVPTSEGSSPSRIGGSSSRNASASVDASASAESSSTTATPASRGTASAGSPGVEAAGTSDAVPGPGSSSGIPAPAPNAPLLPPSVASPKLASVGGVVTHEVWGTPIQGARVSLGVAGRSTTTDGDGSFRFERIPADQLLVLTLPGSGWLSKDGLTRTLRVPEGRLGHARFTVYSSGEAYGRNWRSASSWRDASSGELDSALVRVRRVSATFSSLGVDGARDVLAHARTGSQRDRARAALLATWLNLATTRLGFDTRVDLGQVSRASSAVPGNPTTMLALARNADARIASGSAEWKLVQQALSSDVLDR